MLTLIKIGGSLITDKNVRESFRADVMQRLAQELHTIYTSGMSSLIIGHGSGSFGHFEAKKHNTINGVRTADDWHGFARVSVVAARLNTRVVDVLSDVGLPAMRVQPSALATVHDGQIQHMHLHTLKQALKHHLLPVIYGDVGFDDLRGGTIMSTESIFDYLALNLDVNRILLLGEVDGVYDANLNVIPRITPETINVYRDALRGSGGVDVTGGMLNKVESMLTLVRQRPDLEVRILNGLQPGLLVDVMLNNSDAGTQIIA